MIELWAGAECTVNRVGDRWLDQLRKTGHHDRLDDIDRIAALGARRVRVPVLWERVAPHGLEHADWSWTDSRLARIRELGMSAIVGLVHHGSGPSSTHLLAPSFADGLARFAEAAAERYPWVDAWTPVNEPLTTARFSALYGHWYPHERNTPAFLRALVGQVHATRAAMAAIRRVVPDAQLVQTEDIGHVFGSPALEYQCRYENLRRWLSLDLLAGLVDPDHELFDHLLACGIGEDELAAFVAEPCTPDIVGINYYLTGERYIDERVGLYPAELRGGNGRHAYADVEAVRVRCQGITGHAGVIEAVWRRYRLPIAITEVHLGCTRDEQMRWLLQAWRAARFAKSNGVDMRAITLWSVFGAIDWDSLVTRDAGHYEPGAYDIRAPRPRPTALVRLARALARGHELDHPVLATPGWWHRPHRALYDGHREPSIAPPQAAPQLRPVLVVGASALAARIAASCRHRGLASEHHTRAGAVTSSDARPWAVILVPGAVNGDTALAAMSSLARLCRSHGAACVLLSRDLVFDGSGDRPHVESDRPRPATDEGRAWHRLERRITRLCPDALIVRTGPVLDPHDREETFARVLVALAAGARVVLPRDDRLAPCFATELVHPMLDMLIDEERGIWHASHGPGLSSFDLAHRLAAHVGVPTRRLEAARGPSQNYALTSERAWPLPDLERAAMNHLATWTHNLRGLAA
jgi:dTDP-4-dehydrorhamnose reductase